MFKWECLAGHQVPGLEHTSAWDCSRPWVVPFAGAPVEFVCFLPLAWFGLRPHLGRGLEPSWLVGRGGFVMVCVC